jgi:hypothetical protein
MNETKYSVRWTISENDKIFLFEEIYSCRADAQRYMNKLMSRMENGDDTLVYCGMIDIDDD